MKRHIAISALILCILACSLPTTTRPDTASFARIAPTAEYETAVVTADVLHVRAEPSEKGAVIEYKYRDETVTIYEKTDTGWCLISDKADMWVACWWLK